MNLYFGVRMKHECIIEKKPLETVAQNEWLMVRCRCHMDSFHTWRPGDPEFVCPTEPGMKTN